jgi:hypothetical protein
MMELSITWPPRSANLTTLDFFLWGYMKNTACLKKPWYLNSLIESILLLKLLHQKCLWAHEVKLNIDLVMLNFSILLHWFKFAIAGFYTV